MTSLVKSSTETVGAEVQLSGITHSTGTMHGREIVPQTVANPLIKVLVPSIKDPHPDIPIETLPRSLAELAGNLRALEISLCEVVYTSTEANLLELDRLFHKTDFKDIILRFSFILTLIHTVNRIDFMGDAIDNPMIEITRKETAALLPDLVKNLLEKWEETESQLTRDVARMGSGNRKVALEIIQEVKESFDYLSALFNDHQTRFDIFGTSTVHINQSTPSTSISVADRLEQILRIQTAMLRSFSRNNSFWSAAEPLGEEKGYSDHFDLMQKLIRRRVTQRMFSSESMVLLYESLTPRWTIFGSMHINALEFQRDPSRSDLNQMLGFFPHLYQQLSKELEPEQIQRALGLTMSIPQSYIKMHKQYSNVMQTMHCSTLVQAIKERGSTIDMEALDQMIVESKEISEFFSTMESEVTKIGVYTTGSQSLSFSDMIVHIDNAVGILKELKSSSGDYSESILFATSDLNGSITNTLKLGLEKYLDLLQRLLETFEASHTSKSDIDLVQVDAIIKSIETVVQLITLIHEKSPIIDQLTKRVLGARPPEEKKPPARKFKQKKGRRKKGGRPNHSAKKRETRQTARGDKGEMVSDDKKADSTSDSDSLPDEVKPRQELEEILPPVEEVTQELISTVAAIQKSLSVSSAQTSGTDETVSARNVKWRSLCDELHRAGFRLLRTTGGHRQYQHPEAKGIGVATVPTGSKNSLSIGVVKNVREQIARAENTSHL